MRAFFAATVIVGSTATAAGATCYKDVIDFSEGICAQFVGLSGSSASQKYSGEIDARLAGLLDKLADVGGEIDAAIERESYESILRTDVPRALQEGRTCRLEVAKLFFDKICGDAGAAAMPAPARAAPVAAPDPTFGLQAIIDDPDGYTNVRSGRGTSYQVISRIFDGEVFSTAVEDSPWWQVRTASGIVGYVHRSRIRLLN